MDNGIYLDVSVKETSVCIVDDTDRIVREVKIASEVRGYLPLYVLDQGGVRAVASGRAMN